MEQKCGGKIGARIKRGEREGGRIREIFKILEGPNISIQ